MVVAKNLFEFDSKMVSKFRFWILNSSNIKDFGYHDRGKIENLKYAWKSLDHFSRSKQKKLLISFSVAFFLEVEEQWISGTK